jgi:tetratricopeptide (TPR) repeat protein
MVASGFRGRPTSWLMLGSLLGLACCVVFLVGYWALNFVGWLPDTMPGDPVYLAESRLLREAGSGDAQESKDKLKAAVKQLTKTIADNPDYVPAYYFRAVANQRLGESNVALDDYSEALRRNKQIEGMTEGTKSAARTSHRAMPLEFDVANAYFNRATLLMETGKPGDAIPDFTAALALNHGFAEAYCGRAEAFLKMDEPEQAILDLNESLQMSPNWLRALSLRARAHVAAEDYARGLADARDAFQLKPESADAKRAMALALVSSPGGPREAVEEGFDKNLLRQAAAEHSRALLNQGVRLTNADQPREANRAFNEAERLDSACIALDKEYRARNNLAINGPAPQAVPTSIELEPKLRELVQRPFVALDQSQFDQVVRAFAKIGPIEPKCRDPWIWCGRGLALLEKNDPVSAIGDFGQAIYAAPTFAQAYCLRGRGYATLGNYFRAESDLTEAIRLKPDYALAYLYRADAYSRDKTWSLALADLGQAVALDRNAEPLDLAFLGRAERLNEEICRGQARADLADGHFKTAAASLAAIEKPKIDVPIPTAAPSWLAKEYQETGVGCLKAKKWREAIAGFEKATRLDKVLAKDINPPLAVAHAERGFEFADRGTFREAVADLQAALRLDSHNPQIWRLAGLTSVKLARDSYDRGRPADARLQWQDAIAQLARAIRLDPDLKFPLQGTLEEAQRSYSLAAARP